MNPCQFAHIKGVFKKRPNFWYKDFILQHFKHCPLQSSPLYWRYTISSVSSTVEMLPGTHFL